MKTMMNFTTSLDDIDRYTSALELRKFYEAFGLNGLELMPLSSWEPEAVSAWKAQDSIKASATEGPPDGPESAKARALIEPDMVIGVHACCFGDWMGLDQSFLVEHFRRDLDYASKINAEYVVFHVTQVSNEECFSYQMTHTDEEVVDAACSLINTLLDDQPYSFYFLMENLWWPGLNFLRPSVSHRLLEGVHYKKKGFMLDTGHFLHTDRTLRTQKEALSSLHAMLDAHEDLIPYIKGIHLHQTLSGEYVNQWLSHPPALDTDPAVRFGQVFEHIFRIDQHLPFTEHGVKDLVKRVDPLYLTYEYITKTKEEHAQFLRMGSAAASDL